MPSNFYGCFRSERAATNIVSKLLNFEQKQRVMDIAQEMLTTFNDDLYLLKKVITGDESWGYSYGYVIDTKLNYPNEIVRKTKTEKRTSSSVKYGGFAYCFFHFNGVMDSEYLPQGRTVNKEYYLEVMRRLREVIRQKRTELRKNQE